MGYKYESQSTGHSRRRDKHRHSKHKLKSCFLPARSSEYGFILYLTILTFLSSLVIISIKEYNQQLTLLLGLREKTIKWNELPIVELRPDLVHEDDCYGQITGTSAQKLSQNSTSWIQSLLDMQKDAAVDKQDVDIFIGAMSGYGKDYRERRATMRRGWLIQGWLGTDSSNQHLNVSFAVEYLLGRPVKSVQDSDILDVIQETFEFNDIALIDHVECYRGLAHKTRELIRYAYTHYRFKYLLKLDDDTYIMFERLAAASRQWTCLNADYIGCFHQTNPVIADPKLKWYELAQFRVFFGQQYPVYAQGHTYALSYRAVERLMPQLDSLRQTSFEDLSIGLWMLAFQFQYFDDRRLCSENCCGTQSVALFDWTNPKCNAATLADRTMVRCLKRHRRGNQHGLPFLPQQLNFTQEFDPRVCKMSGQFDRFLPPKSKPWFTPDMG